MLCLKDKIHMIHNVNIAFKIDYPITKQHIQAYLIKANTGINLCRLTQDTKGGIN
jgi:hypothetical protein